MNLKSFGCSFIFGSDLADDGRGKRYATPSKLTWPSLLANKLGRDYSCHARPGAGNLQILERVMVQATSENEDSLYVIGWTWIDRFDYVHPVENLWHTIMPVDEDSVARHYYRDLHSQYRDKLTTLIYIKTAVDILKQHDIPFIMTNIDQLIWEPEIYAASAIKNMQDHVQPYFKYFENKTFLDWSRSQGFEISPAWHPLEPAHAAAADYAADHFLV
jgi:hypothetical protein